MARLNGIDPEAWLRHVLTHIADQVWSTALMRSLSRPDWIRLA